MESNDRVEAPIGEDGKGVDTRWIKVLPCADFLSSCGLRENDGVRKKGVELTEGFFMTMIRFILRNQNDIRRRYLGEMLDGGGNGMRGDGE